MNINEAEIKNVSSLEPFKRYKYLLKKIADNEKVYILRNVDGEDALSTIKEYTLYPLWSASEFAIQCVFGGWSEYKPLELSLQYFMEVILVKIENEKQLLNIFPVGDTTGFVVKPDEFLRDITEELENYE
jgi:hypothetical protein